MIFRRSRLVVLLGLALPFTPLVVRGEDCNRNGIPDLEDIARGTSADCNGNGVPDECDLAPGAISFELSQGIIPPGSYSVSLVSADFDGDGNVDFASAGTDISVLLNVKRGEFEETRYTIGQDSWEMIGADLDGDGDLDLIAVCFWRSEVPVLLNRGDGSFEMSVRPLVPIEGVKQPVAGDFDGDGDIDIVVRQMYSSNELLPSARLLILRNLGGGVLAPAETLVSFPADRLPGNFVAVDLDGDGDLDLVVNDWGKPEAPSRGITVFINDGAGAFPYPVHYSAGEGLGQLVVEDLDGDGHLDLAVTSTGTGEISILRGRGDGTFEAAQGIPAAREAWYLVAHDLDGDGDLDLVAAGGKDTFDQKLEISIHLNLGDGTFGTPVRYELPFASESAGPLLTPDLNGDGRPDVLLGLYMHAKGVIALQNLGEGRFAPPVLISLSFGGLDSIGVADVDGDRDLDLVTGGSGVSLLKNVTNQAFSTGCDPFLRGDVNTDGVVSMSDFVMLRRFLFVQGIDLSCYDAADANDDEEINMCDAIRILYALFINPGWAESLAGPFPVPGPDPTAQAVPSSSSSDCQGPDPVTRLTCAKYRPEPAAATDDVLRIGDVTGFPGVTVKVPVYLTTSVPVDAVQLVLEYDSELLEISPEALSFAGTVYEQFSTQAGPHPQLAILEIQPGAEPGRSLLTAAFVGSMIRDGFEIGPGAEMPVAWIEVQVSAQAVAGTVLTLRPTNGDDGLGIGPYHMRNELTHQGEARFLSLLPATELGRLSIVGDQTLFVRGDANGDWKVDVSDAVHTLGMLFLGNELQDCMDAADADDNGAVELTDAIFTLSFLFSGVTSMPPPYPEPGLDPTEDPLRCRRLRN